MDSQFSAELQELICELTPKQRAAIPRIVERLGGGGSLRSLLRGAGKICTERTFYHRPRGWWHQPAFRAALARARKEFDVIQLETAVEASAERLRRAAPTAVELAEKMVLTALHGLDPDECEQVTSLSKLQELMTGAVKDGDQIRAASVLMGRGLQAALSILDRADIETAVKGARGAEEQWTDLLKELRETGNEVADVGAEEGSIPSPELQSAPKPGAGASEPGAGDTGGGS